jgi:HK97 family phage portal protein
MKWEKTGMDNEAAQYIEIRQFQVEEAARMVEVPAILLYSSTSTATFASSKELVQSFLKFSLDPWLTYWEQEYNSNIVAEVDRGRYYTEFIRQAIERMDALSRAQLYQILIQSRVMNPNEARVRENMNPYDGGDEFENPNTSSDGGGSPPGGGGSEEEDNEE